MKTLAILIFVLSFGLAVSGQTPAEVDASIAKTKSELRSAQVELNELQRKYSAEYPAIVKTKEKIDQLSAELQRLNGLRPPAAPSTEKMTPVLMVAKIGTLEQLVILCALDPIDDKCAGSDPARELTNLRSECVKNAECASALVAKTIAGYTSLREGARSAVQVSQAADEYGIKMQMIQIAQNQRIIELLEALTKKKP